MVEHALLEGLTLELTPDDGAKQGLGLWTLGLAAARWASSLPGQRVCRGARVLELGSGVGLAGLACGIAAAEVTLTDYEDDVLAQLRRHVALNLPRLRPGVCVRVAKLDWDAAAAAEGSSGGSASSSSVATPEPEPEPEPEPDAVASIRPGHRPFDVVLGADVCYSGMSCVPDLFDDDPPAGPEESEGRAWDNSANVAETLSWCMARPGGVAHLFVHGGRSPDEVSRFSARAAELGMTVATEPLPAELLAPPLSSGAGEAAGCWHEYAEEEGLAMLVVRWRPCSDR